MDSDDIKWKSVQTTSREIMYYTNKITGQQKWTNKNCYCSKRKDPSQPTMPCCHKQPTMNPKSTKKGWTDHSYARRQIRSSLTRNLYCLSDIVSEVKKSYLAKEHRKRLRRKISITLECKKKLAAAEDPKTDVTINMDSCGNDESTEKSKDDVVFIFGLQDDASDKKELTTANNDNELPKDLETDVNATLDLKLSSEDTKIDVSPKGDSVSDANISKDSLPLSEQAKDSVVGIKDIEHEVTAVDDVMNDVTVANDTKDVTLTSEDDVTDARDSGVNNDVTELKPNDVTVSNVSADEASDACGVKGSTDIPSKEPSKTNDTDTENTVVDVTTIDDFNNDVTVVKDPIDIIVTTDKEISATDEPAKDPNGTSKTNKGSDNENMEVDVTTVDDPNDVTVVKDPINVVVTTDMEIDVGEAKDSSDIFSNKPSKTNKKITHERGKKRKRDASPNVNGYKGRLRVHRENKMHKHIRRKYKKRKSLKNVAFSSEAVQPESSDTPNNRPSKKAKLGVHNQVLQADDLIAQSIIEINRYTSAYSAKVNKPVSSEKDSNKASNVPVQVSHLRFIDEKFVRMNIPYHTEHLAEVHKKVSKKPKANGSVEKKHPIARKRPRQVSATHSVASPEINLFRPVVIKKKNPKPSTSSSCTSVIPVTLKLSSLTNNSVASREAVSQADEKSSFKTLSLPNFVMKSSPPSKRNFPPRKRIRKSLRQIVDCMNSPNKAEVPLTSTVPVKDWSKALSEESKKVTNSRPDYQENDPSGDETSLDTEIIDVLSCENDVGVDCPESGSSIFGHIKEAFSIANMPQTPEPVSQEGEQLSSGRSITPDPQKSERKTRYTRETGADTIDPELLLQTSRQRSKVTEVPASYVDLSWRIVTTNDGHSSSLSNFFKLVPVTIERGPSCTVDAQEPMSFLGVPIHGGLAVIAKILNTSTAQNCNEVFKISRRPNIETTGAYVKKSTLSFVWDKDAVLVNSKSLKAGSLSGKGVKPRPPIWIDMCNRVSIVLPKPLRLPEAGNVVYLGDFNVKLNCVEFVVTHSVVVTSSPRPSLTVPSGTPVNSSSTFSQTVRCRTPVKAKSDAAQVAKKNAVGRKPSKKHNSFQKCVFCGADMKCRKDVKIHRMLHPSYAGTKCSECRRRFNDGGRLSVHLDTHKCNWLHACAICNKTFKTPKFLTPVDLDKDYYKMCLPCRRQQLKCKKCTETLLSFEDLEVHLKEKHGLYCSICKCRFFFKRDLGKHMETEHGILGQPPSASTTGDDLDVNVIS